MLKILFFARLREELETGSLDMQWTADLTDIDSLQAAICGAHGERWSEVLGQENVIRAVNHAVVAGNCPIQDGDEVAFYPPVTGG
jgi:molybdopterin synthase sulfur carrier subunit